MTVHSSRLRPYIPPPSPASSAPLTTSRQADTSEADRNSGQPPPRPPSTRKLPPSTSAIYGKPTTSPPVPSTASDSAASDSAAPDSAAAAAPAAAPTLSGPVTAVLGERRNRPRINYKETGLLPTDQRAASRYSLPPRKVHWSPNLIEGASSLAQSHAGRTSALKRGGTLSCHGTPLPPA